MSTCSSNGVKCPVFQSRIPFAAWEAQWRGHLPSSFSKEVCKVRMQSWNILEWKSRKSSKSLSKEPMQPTLNVRPFCLCMNQATWNKAVSAFGRWFPTNFLSSFQPTCSKSSREACSWVSDSTRSCACGISCDIVSASSKAWRRSSVKPWWKINVGTSGAAPGKTGKPWRL